jgi:cadmium resistance protein CadD (predicted permease)
MSGLGKWSLGIGTGLLAVAVLFRAMDLIPVTVIAGILGLIAIGMAGYDAVYEWLGRAQRRRGAAKARREREREARDGR